VPRNTKASYHILIIEDEPNTADMLRAYFESQHYQVSTVGRGKKALAFVRETLPDLIMLDVRLPDIDGYEVCRQVRGHRRTAQVPIIFLTGMQERIDRLVGLELGAVDYVTKPFDIQELRLRVRNILRRANLRPLVHPVTGLSCSSLVEEQLGSLADERHWAVLAVALDGLGAFADIYGFAVRDDVLRAVALIVEHVVVEEAGDDHLVGHLSDALLCAILAPDSLARAMNHLTTRLRESLPLFYPRADWEAGRGELGGSLPQLSIRMGTVTDPWRYKDTNELAEALRSCLVPLS
jgi:PleD family two-component response regulator